MLISFVFVTVSIKRYKKIFHPKVLEFIGCNIGYLQMIVCDQPYVTEASVEVPSRGFLAEKSSLTFPASIVVSTLCKRSSRKRLSQPTAEFKSREDTLYCSISIYMSS
jgi:hypothetical protein